MTAMSSNGSRRVSGYDTNDGPENWPGALAKGETWQDCPYYPHHKTLKAPQSHKMKCKEIYEALRTKNGLEMDFAICRYNHDHHIHITEIAEHEEICRMRWGKDYRKFCR